MMKKTELFSDDSCFSVCIQSNSDDDLVIFSITEYDSEGANTPMEPINTVEVYFTEKEAGQIKQALNEILKER